MDERRTIAYFSMEVGLAAEMPTYSGGLGVLAGDTIRSAADLRVPMVAVTLLHRKGFFHQSIDSSGWQREGPVEWAVEDFLEEMPQRASVTIEGRVVRLRSWKYEVNGAGGFVVPVYFLDADLGENSEWDRALSHFLYGGDQHYRLCQEVILGIGGVRMLRALGYNIRRFHMNEGHASLLTLALLDEEAKSAGRGSITSDDIEAVREKCIFTTHTPVPAGHDQFPLDLVRRVIGPREDFFDMTDSSTQNLIKRVLRNRENFFDMKDLLRSEGRLNMTYLALNLSRYINGVAKKHSEVSRLMFAGYSIDAITNGVHAATWVTKPLQGLYDRYIPGWREDNFSLRYAISIPRQEVWQAHIQAKKQLMRYVNSRTDAEMDTDTFTLGFARRATTYKRGDLLFQDTKRLRRISLEVGSLQVIYAGKAHPQDQGGKEIINQIFRMKEALKKDVKIVYLENYDMELAKMIISGVDVWLNTPKPPLEASGTSGMKAALNGVPSLSILDGWWIEGHIEGVTGWSIGEKIKEGEKSHDPSQDAASLYEKLEKTIIPTFYHKRDHFIDVMRYSITLNGSFFNTQRMMQQYVLKAYF
ncbi:MAG: alpha-glucan family phosphorylase [Thermodesulfobacteriota bacterium]|nr:alpha-glucan family phosphorylase [Thermodesulfobacteriota bacterium]